MGTAGSVTVRWKNCYWTVYHWSDAYPSGLGLEVLDSIPKDPHEYQKWMEDLQRKVEDKVNDCLHDGETVCSFDDEEVRTTEPEPFGCDYEIDLDHEVFLYYNKPLFSLKSMPPAAEFERIADNSNHHYLFPRVPEQYKYDWKATPPTVNPSDLKTYHSLIGPDAVIDDINCSTSQSIKLLQRNIPLDITGLGVSIITRGLWPMIFDFDIPSSPPSFLSLSEGYDWIVWGRCVAKVVTHLDDGANLQAAIVEIINLMQEKYDTRQIRAIYGILFSFSHSGVLVRAEFSSGTFTYTHSPALKFFPVEYPVDRYTPGIIAVARLGHLLYRYTLDSWFSVPSIIKLKNRKKEPAVLRVPTEIWRMIADQLHYYADLKLCASFSKASKEAIIDSMSFPRVDGATLFSSAAQGKARTTKPQPRPSTEHGRTKWDEIELEWDEMDQKERQD
ncbi:hypothetical protein VKT23_011522 [Stygiomarasmius scandens]|uniref:F-box domain-containing protein n=1 Tax=Marasmiellus scandens TaxID=2682957 RepID=A0ABR1J9D8_9AGAR